jgi:hypothetical protein
MNTNFETQSKTTGTTVGATLSLLLIVAFGCSSFLAHQKVANPNASQQDNYAAVVRTYLA